MQIRIKDVANLSTDVDDGVYDSQAVPTLGDYITYGASDGIRHYQVEGIWHAATPVGEADSVWLFCTRLQESPFETFKRHYNTEDND